MSTEPVSFDQSGVHLDAVYPEIATNKEDDMSATMRKKPLVRRLSLILGSICLPLTFSMTDLFAASDVQTTAEEGRQAQTRDTGYLNSESPAVGTYSGPGSDSEEHENRGEGRHEEGEDDDEVSEVSINSTSQNNPDGPPEEAIAEQPFVDLDEFTVIAVNDLGIHCGDMDTRNVNILPPFNVMHAVVIQRGKYGPVALDDSQVKVLYSAVSNPNDPALALEPVLAPDGSVFKTNFWDAVTDGAYDPLYPPPLTPLDDLVEVDGSLPVPDIEEFVLGSGDLLLDFQFMPGAEEPYEANNPEPFELFVEDFPLFTQMPFGYVAGGVNWFSAEGIPITTFDDFGRENPYPLMRVQAVATKGNQIGQQAESVLASIDSVVPVSGETRCTNCHAAREDGGNGTAIERLEENDIEVVKSTDDPEAEHVIHAASVEYASDLNILRLHDLKHGDLYSPSLEERAPVVCQICHYTPALDLAQLGPLGPDGELANGREQTINKSMSRAMHYFHYSTGLFAELPPPDDPQRTADQQTSPVNDFEWDTLLGSCFQCHPGERTKCLRGPMFSAGMLCQDCHGSMGQVGNDFSANVSIDNPGAFILADDFYTNPDTPRVPWANEPGCQSCHTGDALSNLAGEADTIAAPDGIRLLQAYRVDDSKATPILAQNQRFAETQLENGNPMLYRLSTDKHAGLFCEACHGPTHGEWPVTNPAANDQLAATQLQGHSGFIMECVTCHEPTDDGLPLGLDGPHGMHPIADFNGPDQRWNISHESFAAISFDECRTCHGADLEGTVLARTVTERLVQCMNDQGTLPECAAGEEFATLPKGTAVSCSMCHADPFDPDVLATVTEAME